MTPAPPTAPPAGRSTSALDEVAGLAAAYARSRTAADLDRLRDAVRRSPGFDPGLDVTTVVRPLLAAGRHAEVVAAVRDLMPGAFLSPSAHLALATAHDGLGDAERAGIERGRAWLALASIASTGDGAPEHPVSVLRVSDEYDVLRSRGLRPAGQRTVTRGGRDLDVLHCSDGSDLWFDVTALRVRG
ncbi:DUF4919 domain-containing protein [Nocardioides marmotae]|uniref:DUF4919 domain-containing protein n=1 Tax=Nocardioides marmotae TaxID=2663857 RepID=UPI0018A6E8B9|nr:DUF4919 domain-containing protein [Nocardioides marmotae]